MSGEKTRKKDAGDPADRDDGGLRRLLRIEKVLRDVHAEATCARWSASTGESVDTLLMELESAIWCAWPPEFDESDAPFRSTPGLTAQSWTATFVRNRLNELHRQRRKGCMRGAPDKAPGGSDLYVALWDGTAGTPEDGGQMREPVPLVPESGPGVSKKEQERVMRRIAAIIDPDGRLDYRTAYSRAKAVCKELAMTMASRGRGMSGLTCEDLEEAVNSRNRRLDTLRRESVIRRVREESGLPQVPDTVSGSDGDDEDDAKGTAPDGGEPISPAAAGRE